MKWYLTALAAIGLLSGRWIDHESYETVIRPVTLLVLVFLVDQKVFQDFRRPRERVGSVSGHESKAYFQQTFLPAKVILAILINAAVVVICVDAWS